MTVNEVLETLCALAPLDLAMGYDNAGFLVGDGLKEVKKVLVCLDCDVKVVNEAVKNGCNLIVSHHPIMFGGIKHITQTTAEEKCIIELIKNDVSLISMHTNLDSAKDGLNDYFAKKLGLSDIKALDDEGGTIGAIGRLCEKMQYQDFIKYLKEKMGMDCVRFCGNETDMVETVALCTGSGGEFMNVAYSMGADVYVSADIKYNIFRSAYENNRKLIDAGHYETEICVIDLLYDYLSENTNLEVIKSAQNVRAYKFGY